MCKRERERKKERKKERERERERERDPICLDFRRPHVGLLVVQDIRILD